MLEGARMKRDGSLEMQADTIARLMAAPRTSTELCDLTGYTRETIKRHFKSLRGEGLIEPEFEPRRGRGGSPRWFWGKKP